MANQTTAELVRTIRTSTLIKWLLDESLRARTLKAYGFVKDEIPVGLDAWDSLHKTMTRFENEIEDEIDRRTAAP